MRRVLITIIALICIAAQAQNMQAVLRRSGAASGEVEYDYNLVRDITGNGYSLTNVGTELELVGDNWIAHFNETNYLMSAAFGTLIDSDTVGSVAGRVRCNQADMVGALFSFSDKDDAVSMGELYQNSDQWCWVIYNDGSGKINNQFTPYTITTNWIDFVLVQNGVKIVMYIDTVLYTNTATVRCEYWAANIGNVDMFNLGGRILGNTPSQLFDGDIDYITYYRNVINGTDVTNLYNDVAITNIPAASWDMRPETK